MGIRYSTAKTILKVFKKTGRIEKKKKRTKKGPNMGDTESLSPHISEPKNVANQFSAFSLSPTSLFHAVQENQEFLLKNYGLVVPLPADFWSSRITMHLLEKDAGLHESPQKLVS